MDRKLQVWEQELYNEMEYKAKHSWCDKISKEFGQKFAFPWFAGFTHSKPPKKWPGSASWTTVRRTSSWAPSSSGSARCRSEKIADPKDMTEIRLENAWKQLMMNIKILSLFLECQPSCNCKKQCKTCSPSRELFGPSSGCKAFSRCCATTWSSFARSQGNNPLQHVKRRSGQEERQEKVLKKASKI